MDRLARIVARHPKVVAVIGIALWAVALLPASRLKLGFDLVTLLPSSSEAAAAYGEYLRHFGGIRTVFVLVEGADSLHDPGQAQLVQASARISDLLEASDEVASVRSGLEERDIRSYLENTVSRAPLLIRDEGWRDEVRSRLEPEAIHRRVLEIQRSVQSIMPSRTRRLAPFDPLGFAQLLPPPAIVFSGISMDPLTGSFLSQDGNQALIIVEPKADELDAAAGRRLQNAIDLAAARIGEEFESRFVVRAVGGPLYAAHDEQVIRGDLQSTLSLTALICGGLLVAAFGGAGIPVAVVLGLGAAVTWLAAGISLTVGTLSGVAVGFTAVLVGLGIDTGIHGGASFSRRRVEGLSGQEALIAAFRETGPPALAAAATTAAAFGVLLVSKIPPLREVGAVVSAGLLCVVVSTATFGASLALLLSRPRSAMSRVWESLDRGVGALVDSASRRPRSILVAAGAVTLLTLPGVVTLRLQPDLEGLRPVDHPVLEAEEALESFFGLGQEDATVLVVGESLDEALIRARSVVEVLKDAGGDLEILSPTTRLSGPLELVDRLRELEELPIEQAITSLRTELPSAGLAPEAFGVGLEALEALARGEDPAGGDLVEDDQVREDPSGSVWVAVAVRPRKGIWSDGPPESLLIALKQVEPEALVASVPRVGRELQGMVGRDLRRLLGLSMALVLGVVLISFRGRVQPGFLALVPVLLGTIWAVGFWSLMGRSLDLVGLAVLPVMVGLGIDDGLHAVHGAVQGSEKTVAASVKRVAVAMVLTTLTTSAGFASLGLSHLPALQAAALLVPMGVMACLLATVAVLPALGSVLGTPR